MRTGILQSIRQFLGFDKEINDDIYDHLIGSSSMSTPVYICVWQAKIIIVGNELKQIKKQIPTLKTLCFYQLSTLDLERLRQLSI